MKRKEYKLTKEGLEHLNEKKMKLEAELVEVEKNLQLTVRTLGMQDSQYSLLLRNKSSILKDLGDVDEILENSKLLKKGKSRGKVELGSQVRLVNHNFCYQLQVVSTFEADPSQLKISDRSPIGRAIIGKTLGEEVLITTPAGPTDFVIEQII